MTTKTETKDPLDEIREEVARAITSGHTVEGYGVFDWRQAKALTQAIEALVDAKITEALRR